MSKTIKYWCDSGVNIHSCREGEVTVDELGMTVAEWDALSEDEKNEIMRDIALERLDWGFSEVNT